MVIDEAQIKEVYMPQSFTYAVQTSGSTLTASRHLTRTNELLFQSITYFTEGLPNRLRQSWPQAPILGLHSPAGRQQLLGPSRVHLESHSLCFQLQTPLLIVQITAKQS